MHRTFVGQQFIRGRRFQIAMVLVLGGLFGVTAAWARTKPADTTATGQKSARKDNTSPAAASVDLNNASEKDLDSLPGVGPATVKKIISHRPYQSVDDLGKAGLTAKEVERIRPMVMVGKPPSSPVAGRPMPGNSPSTMPAPRRTPAAAPSSPGRQVTVPRSGSGMVWVNSETKVYHREGDPFYGKTKRGSYMSEPDAVKAGYRAAKH